MEIEGPLAPWVSAMDDRLGELGYCLETTRLHRRHVAKLSGFLTEGGLGVSDVNAVVLDEFCESLRREGRSLRPTARSFGWLVSLLSELGVLSTSESTGVESEVDALVARYRRFLLDERGLKVDTAEDYERPLRLFIAEVGGEVDRWTATDVAGFMTGQARRLHARSLERTATSLRSFLRFALVEG